MIDAIIDSTGAMQPPDGTTNVLLATHDTEGCCALLRSVVRRGQEPPRHVHSRENELCYVLTGTLTYHVGEAVHEAMTGACVWLPRNVAHSFVVHSPEASILTFYLPGGFEDCIRVLDTPVAPALAVERLIAVAATYGCEIVGPPGLPPAASASPASTSASMPQSAYDEHRA